MIINYPNDPESCLLTADDNKYDTKPVDVSLSVNVYLLIGDDY